MKILSILLFLILGLQAGMLGYGSEEKSTIAPNSPNIYDLFNRCVSDINAIVKHGEYQRSSSFSESMKSLEKRINEADMDTKEKQKIQQELKRYGSVCQNCINAARTDAPKLNSRYLKVLNGLDDFERHVISTGFVPLIREWHKLGKIKKHYVQRPTNKLEKEFAQTFDLVLLTVTELYLDEEQEEPMMTYLKNYQEYFSDLSRSYKKAKYEEINTLKPLGYKIKSLIKLSIPYNL